MVTKPPPRSFVWLQANGQMIPQIWFDKPPVGGNGMMLAAQRVLDPSEYALTLDQLVKKYPVPLEIEKDETL